ncbi:unnamed protein product [Bemisia tabaci]|uniref:Uncharacterized protein n=1 Tax=Bemisia tabaci TaxID=7038 RepID=A0A9P0C7C6_BEMTA|nr:unnamed protein product [Bemisia tabaci]
MVFYYEKMPQTVPSNDFSCSTLDYSTDFLADSFDLSLLPSNLDSQVPGSGQNLEQIFSFYSENSPLPMFPNTTIGKESDLLGKGHSGEITCDLVLSIKKEPFSDVCASPMMGSYVSSPSPPFQECPASPEAAPLLPNLKQEAAVNIQDILEELRQAQRLYMQDKRKEVSLAVDRSPESSVPETVLEKEMEHKSAVKPEVDDHRLLREVLKDTSFQKKYHLRPFDMGDLGTGFQPEANGAGAQVQKQEPEEVESAPKVKSEPEQLAKDNIFGVDLSQEGIGPVFSLALEQLKKDVHNTSTILGISRDPVQWSEEDVKCWVLWNLRQYNQPLSTADFFKIKGSELVTLSEEKFQEISFQSGSLLYAQLEIWKAVCLEDTHLDVSNLLYDSPASQSNSSSIEMTDEEEEDEEMVPLESLASPPAGAAGGGKISGRGSGSHIHLWQFLKELLASPQAHCSCIRWLDRSKGVFKIEDSVKVARLWGMRKNRPAMNYDKLSRSIRQYYKKGIMKKTERSQRLVYQFCHPYSL